MEKRMEIQAGNIIDPPEKMRLMYEAVSELIREHKDITALKVSEITAKAGIGKGTAYEYFSSKEELITHALMYEYSNKIQELAKSVFESALFKVRCYRVMDWIKENKEYNQMFTQLFMTNRKVDIKQIGEAITSNPPGCQLGEFGYEAHNYIHSLIDVLMEDACKEGVITETDAGKCSLALLMSMVEYAFVVMGPSEWRYEHLGDEELRAFVYESLVKALN